MTAEIHFYRTTDIPWGAFSNLTLHEIDVRGLRYRSVEDAYQSLKPRKSDVRAWLSRAPNPRLVAITAHALAPYDIAPGWDAFRARWMFECLGAKYRQHDDLAALLLSTESARLVETGGVDSEVNRRWGEVDGRGGNWLGRMLMLLRQELGGAPWEDEAMHRLIQDGNAALERWYRTVHAA